MNRFVYTGDRLNEIAFPLGGIGTGCIGLGGDGRLVDWEIANRPSKGTLNGYSHFAIRAEQDGKVLDTRVLHGDLKPPYTGSPWRGHYWGLGYGPRRETLAGLPHFRKTRFTGEFPLARVEFRDKTFPGAVQLDAFNPFIPHNPDDSGIPAAFFEFDITNTTGKKIDYTLAGVLGNPLPGNQIHRTSKRKDMRLLHLGTDGVKEDTPRYGDLTLATDAEDTSHQLYWFRGGWFDALEIYWRDLTTPGPLKNRNYNPKAAKPGTFTGNHGVLAAHVSVPPGVTARVRFVIAWNYPVCENYWHPPDNEMAKKARVPLTWKNYYATIWKDSKDSAAYALRNWDRLYDETHLFHDALFRSTLPDEVLDAVSANISILKSPTVLRLEDGTFYGFEGCHVDCGCCPGTCTHVWNYAQALPFLFPSLERSVREVDYEFNQLPNGGMPFRLILPLGVKQKGGRSCADGLFGNVLMVYRDWKICGDDEWLRELWPAIRKSIEYAWHPKNVDRWDPDKTGVLWGRQHHTLDMELFGPSSWLCGMYLGALKAGAEMAEALNDKKRAAEYAELFEKGRAWVDEHLFNGEYYYHEVDLNDRSVLAEHKVVDTYWDEEHGEIKYQIGEGSSIDQTLAQYHANLSGLGEIFDPRKARKALKAIYRHNFKPSMRTVYNPCRLYALNDDAGAVICAWPEDRRKPAIPAVYSQETMHGFEYAAAVQMIQSGMVEEGLELVRGVRDRYDGAARNPWNEFECGNHYARSMASYALLNALSGFRFDLRRGFLGFDPASGQAKRFRCFWSVGEAWGEFELARKRASLRVLAGEITVRSLGLPSKRLRGVSEIRLREAALPFEIRDGEVALEEPVVLIGGDALEVAAPARKGKRDR